VIKVAFIGFKTVQAVPVKVPMSNWIYAANDDVIFSKPKKF